MPLHNYPRTQNGVCAGCDCADDNTSGNYYAQLIRVLCNGGDSITWTLCNVPQSWHDWVQAGAGPADGSQYGIPDGQKYRIVPGQSDHLGIPDVACWIMITGENKKTGCFENQVDFADVFSDFGYSAPGDVPDSGYVDSSGNPDVQECCDENAEDDDFFPLVPKRYVLKFRERGLQYSGTFWMSSTTGLTDARPPTIGAFNVNASDSVCSSYSAGFGTGAFFGGNHKASDFGVKDWYTWTGSAPIGYVDVEHGADECFPDVPDSSYASTARVWWPCNQLHVDYEWEMGCTLDSVETTSDGWKATYLNTSAEWCFGDVTTESVCTNPTGNNPAGVQASDSMLNLGSEPSSWCDSQTSSPPFGSTNVEVPRNISMIRGDGLKVSGTLKVEVCWMLPKTGDVPGLCDSDSDFYDAGFAPGDPFSGLPCGHRMSYPSSVVQAFFTPDDFSDAPFGTYRNWGTAGFAVTQVIGPGCNSPDYNCHYAGACPGDSSASGDANMVFGCFQRRFEFRPYQHRALRTTECAQLGYVIDGDAVDISNAQNGMAAAYVSGFQRTYPSSTSGKAAALNGWVHSDHIPEPGVSSKAYGGTQWDHQFPRSEPIGEWLDDGCGGGTPSTSNVNTYGRHSAGLKTTGMQHGNQPYQTWTVEDECRCRRVDGTGRVDTASGVVDNFGGTGSGREPRYVWSDNHLIFEPYWD